MLSPTTAARIEMISNVVYRQVTSPVGVKPLHMTLFVPGTDSEKRPAIIFFPGGGFMSANKDQFLELRYARGSVRRISHDSCQVPCSR